MKLPLFLALLFSAITLFAKPMVIVSIQPQVTFVEKIAKDLVGITLMVKPGESPHSYEPKASQMVALSKADLYLSIGVEFEDVWLERFTSQNPNLRLISIAQGVKKIPMQAHHHHDHEAKEDDHKETLDPHTWTSPANVAIMAKNIKEALEKIDPENAPMYEKNLTLFLEEIKETQASIKEILKDTKEGTPFIVFHPSWGYFAREFGLTQVAIEVEGKNPKPKEIMMIVKEAKEIGAKALFTQPEFSDKSAKIIADEAGTKVIKTSPLAKEWSQNLIKMAKAIASH